MAHRIGFILILLVLLNSCSKEKTSDTGDLLVARVGPQEISFKDFEISFLVDPKYATRTSLRQARQSQLDFLINEKHAYLAAKKIKLQDEPELKMKIDYIKKQEMLRIYLQQKFIDKINVSTAELQVGLHRACQQVYVQNIFCPELIDAQKIKKEILATKTVDAVFQRQAVELGWVTFGTLDEIIEDAVFNLAAGQISDPIKSRHGYHVLKVDSVRNNPELQNKNQVAQIQQVTDIIRERKIQTEIEKFVAELTDSKQIQVANRSLDLLTRSFAAIPPPENMSPMILAPPLRNNDLQQVSLDLADMLDEPLLKFGARQMTIGDFLQRLKEMPLYHRPYLQGRNRFIQAMIDMTRNDLIIRQAENENFSGNKQVQINYDKNVEELLAREFNRRYHDTDFRQNNPQDWQRYEHALQEAHRKYRPAIFEQNLFTDVQNPDSIMTAAPVPVFFKNRYIW
jgi:hypothetical protein